MKPGSLVLGAAVVGASVLLFMSASSEYLWSTGGMPVFSGLGGVAQDIAEQLGAASTSDRRGVLQLVVMASMVGMVGGSLLVIAQVLPAQEGAKSGKKGKGGKGDKPAKGGKGAKGDKRGEGGRGDNGGKGESGEDKPKAGKQRAKGAAKGGRNGRAGRGAKVGVKWKGRG